MTRAWERLPEETAKAYQAFSIYRDQGPARSTAKVARELGKTKTLMDRWCSRHQWVERAAALDARDDQIRNEALELHKLRAADDYAERREALRLANLRNEERAAEVMGKFLDAAEPGGKGVVVDAERLHKIATRNEPVWIDPREFDLESATDEQLDRIINGEDPRRVLGD